jgi:biuret amidohydrolase
VEKPQLMKGFRAAEGDLSIDPRRTAVIAMHWQEDVVAPKGAFGDIFAQAVTASGVVARTASMLDQARSAGCTIIYVNIVYRPGYSGTIQNNALFRRAVESGGFIAGTPGVEIIKELRPQPSDLVIDHARSSAFFGSDLLTILIGTGIDTVALSGIATNVAVDHTARDAMQYGYTTIFLEDCCFSSDPEHHRAALVTMRALCSAVVDGDAFARMLRRPAAR